jgi:MerR family transcriptional regulator, light-induced transcriptional regulator
MTNSSRFLQNYSTTPLYNTKLVVSETGVPADTFRAWERRYGLPHPHRAEGGQRLYSDRDIATIRWLRDRTSEGLTISQAVALLESETNTPPPPDQPRSYEALRADLRQSLLQFDAPGADALLGEAFALYSLDSVCVNIIQPTLVDIGEMWHLGTASVAQEHFASQFLRRKLLALLNIYDVSEGRATVVAACAPGEQHDLGLLLLALFLVRRNYRVVFLGADVPIDALKQAVDQVRPEIVCISTATTATIDHAIQMSREVHTCNKNLLIFIGGQGAMQHAELEPGIHFLKGNGIAAAEQIGVALHSLRASGVDRLN